MWAAERRIGCHDKSCPFPPKAPAAGADHGEGPSSSSAGPASSAAGATAATSPAKGRHPVWSQGHFYLQGGEGKPAALQEGRLACGAICAPRKDGALC